MTREEIVVANIDRTIGRYQSRRELTKCVVDEEASCVVIKLLETSRCEIIRHTDEPNSNIKREVSKVINRCMGQFRFREETSGCEKEKEAYQEARCSLSVVLEDYLRLRKKQNPLQGMLIFKGVDLL